MCYFNNFTILLVDQLFIQYSKNFKNKYLPRKGNIELKSLCETRWICQIAACIAIKKTFSIILLLLNKLSLETKSEKGLEAKSLLIHINFEFIFCLYLFCDTFSKIKIVSDHLQKADSDLGSSCILVDSLINYLTELRNMPDKFETLMKEVEFCSQKYNI